MLYLNGWMDVVAFCIAVFGGSDGVVVMCVVRRSDQSLVVGGTTTPCTSCAVQKKRCCSACKVVVVPIQLWSIRFPPCTFFLHRVSSTTTIGHRVVGAHIRSTVLARVGRRLELDGRMMDLELSAYNVLCLCQNPIIVCHRQCLVCQGADRCQLQMNRH